MGVSVVVKKRSAMVVEYSGVRDNWSAVISFRKPNQRSRDEMRTLLIGLGCVSISEKTNGRLTYVWVKGLGQVI